MTIAQILPIVVNVSIAMIVLGLGLKASVNDALHLLAHPGLLLRSLFSMSVAMPIFAVLLCLIFGMHGPIGLALISLSLSPVPPFLPTSQVKGGGTTAFAVSLLVLTSILAIVTVPFGISAIEQVLHVDADIPRVAGSLALTITLPLVTGMVLHDFYPEFAAELTRPISTIGMAMVLLVMLPVLFVEWPVVWSMVGNGTLLALVLFSAVGLGVGHLLGGPAPRDRLVLALATASRHPGVALAVAAANTEQIAPVASVVIWHLLVAAVLAGFYARWMHLIPATEPEQSRRKTARHSPPIR